MTKAPGLPKVRVDVGFTSPYVGDFWTVEDPVRGAVDSGHPIGADDIWEEIPNTYVRSWSVRLGASQGNTPTRRYDPGTATIVFHDPLRWFDPDNLAGPYVSGGVSQITPMRRVRITVTWNKVAYPVFTGYADDWTPEYVGGFWTYTTLTATDATKVFADEDRPAVAPVGPGEHTGARIGRILDSIDWPAEDRLIDTGDLTVQATVLSGTALAELQLTQDTELGEFFVDAQGRAVFQDRSSVSSRAASNTSQATFGDGGYAATGELPYADVTLSGPDESLVNKARITMVGGTEQVAVDTVSQGAYLTKTYERSDLIMETDADALDYANAIVYRHKDAVRRFATLQFVTPSPEVAAVMWPQRLGRAFGDRITVVRRPAGGGAPIQHDAFIRGVTHESNGESFTSGFVLQATDRYTFFTVEHPLLGQVEVYPIGF